jgi:hypothetical protein
VTEPFGPTEPPVQPDHPVPPAAPAAPAAQTDMERAIAEFDAREQARAARPQAVYTPFALADVDRRVWIGAALILAIVAVGVGGPPWQSSFWITLGLLALIGSPFVVGAIFFWQRERS